MIFSTVLKRFCLGDSKNVFVLVLAYQEPELVLFEVETGWLAGCVSQDTYLLYKRAMKSRFHFWGHQISRASPLPYFLSFSHTKQYFIPKWRLFLVLSLLHIIKPGERNQWEKFNNCGIEKVTENNTAYMLAKLVQFAFRLCYDVVLEYQFNQRLFNILLFLRPPHFLF